MADRKLSTVARVVVVLERPTAVPLVNRQNRLWEVVVIDNVKIKLTVIHREEA